MLGDTGLGFWEFVQGNWGVIAATLSAIATASATAFVYCIRAIWIHAAKPLIEYIRDKYEDFAASHKSFLNGIDTKVGAIVDTQEKISGQIGGRFELHKTAIAHTADGLIAHADGKPDEAKQYAAKAKDAVK